MKILSFDTCCGGYSIAILIDGKITASFREDKHNQQSTELFSAIGGILSKYGFSYNDFDIIAVTVGPGSFTGIRIGIAAAQGIAAVTKAKLIGITTFEAFAYRSSASAIVAIEAGRNQYYCQEFFDKQPVSIPMINSMAEVIEKAAGKELLGNINNRTATPDAKEIAKLAFDKIKYQKDIMQNIEPFYIREPDAKIHKN